MTEHLAYGLIGFQIAVFLGSLMPVWRRWRARKQDDGTRVWVDTPPGHRDEHGHVFATTTIYKSFKPDSERPYTYTWIVPEAVRRFIVEEARRDD